MNYGQLKTRVLDDTHRQDYLPLIAEFVAQGEALIESELEAYTLVAVLTDADRASNVYTVPASRITLVKCVYVSGNPLPLTQCDETQMALLLAAGAQNATHFTVRADGKLAIAGNPGTGVTVTVTYFGMPARLSLDADTNTLLTDYPQLYLEAISVYIWKRAKDLETSSACFQSVTSFCRNLNRRMKKRIGGSEAVGPYNTDFRSSY